MQEGQGSFGRREKGTGAEEGRPRTLRAVEPLIPTPGRDSEVDALGAAFQR